MTETFVTEAALTKARFWEDSIFRFVKASGGDCPVDSRGLCPGEVSKNCVLAMVGLRKGSFSRLGERSFLQRFVSKSHALIKVCFDGGVLWRGMRPLAAKMR